MKKILALMLALIAVFNISFVSAVHAESIDEKDRNLIVSLGIMEEINENTYLTREVYSKAILTCFGYNEINPTDFFEKNEFSDLEIAAGMEFIGLNDSGDYDAEGYATFGEVVRDLVTLLGYDTQVRLLGGTAQSFLTKGQQLGITKGTGNKGFSSKLTEIDLAKMIINCLDIPVMMTSIEGSNPVITTYEDETFLSRRQDIYYGKGVVTANEKTTLSLPHGIGEGNVQIENEVYNAGNTDCDELLGYFVEYYYHDNDGEYTLVWAYADAEDNNEIYVEDDDINSFVDGIYYYNDGSVKEKKARLASSVTYIYNGKAAGFNEIPAFIPENGEVTLIDYDNDSKYDVVIIMDYTVALVTDINTVDMILYAQGDTSLKYEFEEYDDVSLFSNEYEETELSKLQTENAIWVAEDLDSTILTILVSDETVEGTVSGKGTGDNDRRYVVIGENEYYYAISSLNNIEIGEAGTFYLDIEGRIVGFETKNLGYQIGWIINAYVSEEDELLHVRLFNGEVVNYACTEKLKFNGSNESYENIISTLKGGNEKVKGQLIRYKLNANDEMLFLQTATDSYVEDNRLFLEGEIPKEGSGVGVLFKKNYGNLFTNSFALEDDCAVFVIPSDSDNYDKYVLGGPELFGNDGTRFGVKGYKLNFDDDRCVAAIWDKTITAGGEASANKPAVLKSINPALLANDEIGYKIEYYDISTAPASIIEMVAYTDEEEFLTGLESGDVIRIDTDDDNNVAALQRIYSANTNEFVSNIQTTQWGGQFRGNGGLLRKN